MTLAAEGGPGGVCQDVVEGVWAMPMLRVEALGFEWGEVAVVRVAALALENERTFLSEQR